MDRTERLRHIDCYKLGGDRGEFAAARREKQVYRSAWRVATTRTASNAEMMTSPRPMSLIDEPKTIVLIGLMGAGKSAIGRRLATRLCRRFVDADSEIEKAAGCSIEDIFELHGEAAFRDGERRVIERLLQINGQVLATGGGAYINSETREAIRRFGISVWLRADLDLLLARTARRSNRPLLKTGDPRDILAGLMQDRYPIYAEADVVVDSADVARETMVDRVVMALDDYLMHPESPAEQ